MLTFYEFSYYVSHDESHKRAEPDLTKNPGAASNVHSFRDISEASFLAFSNQFEAADNVVPVR